MPSHLSKNGLVERNHMQIGEMSHTFLDHASLPIKIWDNNFKTFIYLIIILLTNALPKLSSSFFAFFKKVHSYNSIKVISCAFFLILRPYDQYKLHFSSSKCMFLGVSLTHKRYNCLNNEEKIFISKYVLDFMSCIPH